MGISIPDRVLADCEGSVSYVAQDEQLLGALCFNDTPRQESAKAITCLRDLGVKQFVMLTGDRNQANSAVVAVEAEIADQVIHGRERRVIDLALHELDARRFAHCEIDSELGEGEGKGLPEVSVRRIPQEPRPRERSRSNNVHLSFLNAASVSKYPSGLPMSWRLPG